MNRSRSQLTSVGQPGIRISSDALPEKEVFQFRRLRRIAAEKVPPFPIHFSPRYFTYFLLLALALHRKRSMKPGK
jgi:hypothetical protein